MREGPQKSTGIHTTLGVTLWGNVGFPRQGYPQSMPLTAIEIRNAKPDTRTRKLFDGRVLYLEVTPRGGKRWRLKYRFQRKEKLISLGVYPDISLKEARQRRDAARNLLAHDVDPSAARKAERAAAANRATNSFEAVAREWLAKHGANWVPAYAERQTRLFERDLFPWLGGRPIAEIRPPELLEAARRIEARGALEAAHRALQSCGQVLRYAVATGRAERDPTRDLRGALPGYKGKSRAAITDPPRLGAVLRAIDGYRGSPIVRAALRLAPLVFVRPGESRQAAWEDIDLGKAEWGFTVTKTHVEHLVPLAEQAVAILREVQPLTRRGRYAFPNARSPRGDRPMTDNALLVALRGLGIGKEEMSVHGFRATARTLLDEVLGYRVDYIEHQLAHTVRDPLGRRYNRTTHLPARREMMQRWADYLDELRHGHQQGVRVTPP